MCSSISVYVAVAIFKVDEAEGYCFPICNPRSGSYGVGAGVWGQVLSTGKGLCGFRRQFRGKAVRPDFTRFLPVLRVDAATVSACYKPNDKIL